MKQSFSRLTTQFRRVWEKHPAIAWLLSILWILSLSSLAFLWNLGNIGLIDETEPLFAEAARQMTVTGDWITPYFNGETRFDKPPLIYWLMAIGFKILGVNEWAVRLPSAIAAIALTALTFYTLRYYSVACQENSALKSWLLPFLGAALITLNPITIAWARTGVSDMLLTGCMSSALLCFFLGYARKDEGQRMKDETDNYLHLSPWYLAFYVLIAFAILAKGPVGLVLPLLIIGAFLVYVGRIRSVWQEIKPLWGGLIVAAIALPWYVLVIWQNGGDYIESFFGYHNVQRFTQVVNRHSAPWYFYFLVVLIGFFPWSSYLPLAIARLKFWQRKQWRSLPRWEHLGLFALFWFVGIFGFFTIAVTKLPSYVLPLMPAAAILVALLFSSEFQAPNPQLESTQNSTLKRDNPCLYNSKLFVSGFFNVVFLVAIAGVILSSPEIVGYDPAVPKLPRLLQQSGLPTYGALIWGITAVAAAVLLLRPRRRRWLWSVNLVGFIAFIIFVITPGYFLIDRSRQLPLRELSEIAMAQNRSGEEMLMIGFKKPSIVFYSQRSVIFFPNAEQALTHIEKTAATHPQTPSVLILSQSSKLKNSPLQSKPYQVLGKAGAYRLLRFFYPKP